MREMHSNAIGETTARSISFSAVEDWATIDKTQMATLRRGLQGTASCLWTRCRGRHLAPLNTSAAQPRTPLSFRLLLSTTSTSTPIGPPKTNTFNDAQPTTTPPPPRRKPSLVKDKETLFKLLALAKPHARLIGGGIGLLFVSSAVTMSVPFSMGTIIDLVTDEIASSRSTSGTVSPSSPLSVTTLVALLASVFALGAAANTGRIILFRSASERIIASLRSKLYGKVLKQDMAFHDANQSGELLSRLSVDTVLVGKSVTSNVSDGLRAFVMATTGAGAMCYVNLKLAMIMMSIVPPVALGAVAYGRFVSKIARKTTHATADLTKLAEEKLSSVRTVRAFAQEDREIQTFNQRVETVYELAMREARASGVFFGGAGLSGNLTILAILYYGGSMVQLGEITVGELTSFFLYTAYVGSSMMGLSSWYSELMKGIGASSRLFFLLEEKSVVETNPGRTRLSPVKGKIEFKNVSFAYPTRPDAWILRDLSFTVHPGETVAIVGFSGSGKSTVAQLLFRFYEPLGGQVLVDDTELQELDLTWFRANVLGLVPQEPVLFADSLRNNIRYGEPEAIDDQVLAASRIANASYFIEQFPKGLDTYAGERGLALSGGQKQRIAIARALLKDPQILILDEATSALDAASEHLVAEALDAVVHGRTVITIAHRLSTIQKADRVIMLENGAMAESGTFAELSSRENGKFRALIQKQLLDDDSERSTKVSL